MVKTIRGLADHEQATFGALADQLDDKASRNRLRAKYMDGKKVLRKIPPSAPPYLRNLGVVLGWPAKAVEALHRRTAFEGFAAPGADLDSLGLSEILDANDYGVEVGLGELDALVQSCTFEIVTRGGEGEPAAVISQRSALDATGDWNARARRLDSLLSVVDRDDKGEISDANLYLPNLTIVIEDGEVVDRQSHPWHVPAEVVPYKPRLSRPFGSSRISRAVMSHTDRAMATVLRAEGTADLYGVPWFMIFGPDESAFQKGSWQMIMDRVNAIPDNMDADAANQRADVKQFSQGDQRPHVEQLQILAGLFAGETNIPVSSLGVGLSQANPTSADSYVASREDLIAEAEAAARVWKQRHVRTAQRAWMVANGETVVPDVLRGLQARYRNPRYTSASAAADAATKQVAAFPWLAESDAFVRHVFDDDDLTERLLADKQRSQGRAALAMFQQAGGADGIAGSDPGSESGAGGVVEGGAG